MLHPTHISLILPIAQLRHSVCFPLCCFQDIAAASAETASSYQIFFVCLLPIHCQSFFPSVLLRHITHTFSYRTTSLVSSSLVGAVSSLLKDTLAALSPAPCRVPKGCREWPLPICHCKGKLPHISLLRSFSPTCSYARTRRK